ncbi:MULTISPECIES: DUF4397 domain-containing protein [unclassified Streptomyces]|uniref:DUF4397 domain-containing protein n=1 Tax=unclassified Streptomyces TaxID=2593676 RepID=UPI000693E35F|nr:DUF4397 domain-containing protein [Streptomyces sp. NBC_00370]
MRSTAPPVVTRRSPARAVRVCAAVLLSAALGTGVLAGPAAASGSDAWSGGWVRLAHFSPGAPAVDVYLYPFGGAKAAMVLRNVSYGDASPYESVATGQYTVAMRAAGAAASATPVISSTVQVKKGKAYTVAGLGPGSALQLRTLPDQISAGADMAGLRIIQASLNQPSVNVNVAGGDRSTLRFPTSTPYASVPAGATAVQVSSGGATTSRTLDLAGRSTHTLVVLSSSGAAPKLLDLTDSDGASIEPQGGVEAGFGGLSGTKSTVADASAGDGASSGAGATAGWAAALLAGAALAFFGVRRLRRS